METINFNYQGQPVSATEVHRIDGYDDGENGLRHCWADTLLRDGSGCYYAMRERHTRDRWDQNATITGRTKTTRRISLRAAILWTISLTGYDGLRQDAAALLREPRSSEEQSYAVGKLGRDLFHRLRVRAGECRGGWEYTLPDLLDRGLRVVNEWGKIVELDDRAEALLRRYHREEYGEARYENVMPADVVNGVLVNYLEAVMEIHEGRTDGDAIDEAQARRRFGLSDTDEEVIEQATTADSASASSACTVRFIRREDGSVWDECEIDTDLYYAIDARAKKLGCDWATAFVECLEQAVTRHDEKGEQDNSPKAASERLLVTLDPEASMLVSRFLKRTTHDTLTPSDVATGCVVEMLELALREIEDIRNHRLASEGRAFADNEWGIAEESAYNAYRRRCGLPEHDPSEDNAVREASDEGALRRLGLSMQDEPRATPVRLPDRNPAVMHSLNAPAPEAVEERASEPLPIRDMLADLAAEWRIKAQEARAAGPHGQADSLEQCADEIEALVSGKINGETGR